MAATRSNLLLGGGGGGGGVLESVSFSDQFEFNEADIWNDEGSTEKKAPSTHGARKPGRKRMNADGAAVSGPKSMPVNVPDWSRLVVGESESEEERLPPHEYLARNRAASMSVHEGVGRTLKGRDLSSVRNAVWKKIGFED